ncbi:isopalmitoylresorcinol synthase [Leifsonia sp. 98AMF]|nr:isopalmitoylresorcinol synthase [Leifsonia sp. 197AMF]SDJ40759.1 isopalmitoylresorcinol synthase [Leifsonia sp. 466MF]SDK36867.1 isopalmitoylresorcinol synthase [Leifsonia sp. 157MF]SDN61039.1 isopalmitoylresorcinol synthase [Leifsonia sp. 509MF]SEN48003.1 isopalmitoylresorcinol synthase [Leifsonia sp. 467MF]SFM84656.1 isopalmitoylresorcinol synthase [Leifsonia sp. 98AMF]
MSVAPVLPARSYSQGEITAALLAMITSDPARQQVMRRIHASSGVQTRSLVMPLERYSSLASFQESNDFFIAEGTTLAERAVTAALDSAGLAPTDVDFLLFTSVTGIAAPSIDAQLVSRLGLRTDVKRLPSFGLGCVAGAAGIARVNDYLAGHPDEVAILLSVELCSLTVQASDDSMANIVASGLFGDGAAAVVMVGDRRAEKLGLAGPDVVDSRSHIYPDTADVIGWDIGGTGFRIVLSAGVPEVIERNFAGDARGILAAHDLEVSDVGAWAAHPGGPKVLEAFSQALDLPDGALDASWRSLANVGNLSSAAVLHVLAEQLDAHAAGTIGLLFALGPGVTSELVLLRWADGAERSGLVSVPAALPAAVEAGAPAASTAPAALPAAAMIDPVP